MFAATPSLTLHRNGGRFSGLSIPTSQVVGLLHAWITLVDQLRRKLVRSNPYGYIKPQAGLGLKQFIYGNNGSLEFGSPAQMKMLNIGATEVPKLLRINWSFASLTKDFEVPFHLIIHCKPAATYAFAFLTFPRLYHFAICNRWQLSSSQAIAN